jgi:hypothetical protein
MPSPEATCSHLDQIKNPTPHSQGCEDCLRIGATWVHLRLCEICGHVGCCDSSPNRHASKHYRKTHHLTRSSSRSSPERTGSGVIRTS